MRSPLLHLVLCLGLSVRPAGAQPREPDARSRWSFGLSLGVSSFSVASEGADAEGLRLTFFPYRPTLWGVSAGYGQNRMRIQVAARYGSAGLGARGLSIGDEGKGALLVADDAYHLTTLSAGVSSRLLTLRGGPMLRPSLAFDLERWAGAGSPARWIGGGQAGLALEIGLTQSVSASLEGELGFTPASPFRREDLPEGFQQKSVWRRSLTAAALWRP